MSRYPPVCDHHAGAPRPPAAVVLAAAATVLATVRPRERRGPEGWSDPDAVSVLQACSCSPGIPLLLFLVIAVLVYLPAMVRGERVAPGGATRENQWFGGPRKGTAELAGSGHRGVEGRWRQWPLVTFSGAERSTLDEAIRTAEQQSRVRVLGLRRLRRGRPRAFADPAARNSWSPPRAAS